jgi:hypothetical protein
MVWLAAPLADKTVRVLAKAVYPPPRWRRGMKSLRCALNYTTWVAFCPGRDSGVTTTFYPPTRRAPDNSGDSRRYTAPNPIVFEGAIGRISPRPVVFMEEIVMLRVATHSPERRPQVAAQPMRSSHRHLLPRPTPQFAARTTLLAATACAPWLLPIVLLLIFIGLMSITGGYTGGLAWQNPPTGPRGELRALIRF